ncbi:hypothetical protein Tco_1168480 [Tanacetum coccineum]
MELALFFFSTLADSIGGFSPNNKIRAGGHPVWPTAIHGHSLGRDKAKLLRERRLTEDEISATYKIMRRIEAEEMSLDVSEVVISSTRQDIDERWWPYDNFDHVLEKKICARIRRNVSCYESCVGNKKGVE